MQWLWRTGSDGNQEKLPPRQKLKEYYDLAKVPPPLLLPIPISNG
jgi:hypothetical protein